MGLDGGETDLRRLGFGEPSDRPSVTRSSPTSPTGPAGSIGGPSRLACPLAPVWVGNLVLVAGVVAGAGAVVAVAPTARRSPAWR